MSTFKAYRIHQEDDDIVAKYEDLTLDDLSDGNVVIRASHSGINYKDALAATGAGVSFSVARVFGLACGRNCSGSV